jgi:hypothetical protein
MGGHGGLNMLPQKEWNVYNNDNREVVHRDEDKMKKEMDRRKRKKLESELDDIASTLKGGLAPISNQIDGKRAYKLYEEENSIYHQIVQEEKVMEDEKLEEIRDCMFKPRTLDEHVNLFEPEEIQDKYRTHQNQLQARQKGVGEQSIGKALERNRHSWYNRTDSRTKYAKPITPSKVETPSAKPIVPRILKRTEDDMRKERLQRETKEKNRIIELLSKHGK